MSLLDRIKQALAPSAGGGSRDYWIHARCKRCGEVISARVDMMNDLSKDFDTGQYTVHKVLVGDGKHRCFQRIEITLTFDKRKNLIDRSIMGGEFLEPEQVDEARAAYERAMQEAEEARKAHLAELAARSE